MKRRSRSYEANSLMPILSILAENLLLLVMLALVFLSGASGLAQEPNPALALDGIIEGRVRDSSGRPLRDATLSIKRLDTGTATSPASSDSRSDDQGLFRFSALAKGTYTIHAVTEGYLDLEMTIIVSSDKRIDVDLTMKPTAPRLKPGSAERAISQAPELFDEPQFTVAGVTQAESGGHGSDVASRATEALARETVAPSDKKAGTGNNPVSSTEASLREQLSSNPENISAKQQLAVLLLDRGDFSTAKPLLAEASRQRPQDAEVHHLLAIVDEKTNNALEAVREYQRAAELNPTEQNLFDWGAELLSHLASEPATEVFTSGNRLFPRSSRMLTALGIAWYSRGFYDWAAQSLTRACDLDSSDPDPYLVLGRLQAIHTAPLAGALERLARFAQLHPENALAFYYYAVALGRQTDNSKSGVAESGKQKQDKQTIVQSLLERAIRLDPNLAAAYLQLGILLSQQGDVNGAISQFKKIGAMSSADPDTAADAHYRLAQAYVRTGDKAKATREFDLHRQLARKTEDESARKRRDLQQFIVTLRHIGPEASGDR